MKKFLAVILVISMTALLLAGCSLGQKLSGLKEKLDGLTGAGLVVRITKLEDGYVKAKIVEGDSHFKPEEEINLFYDTVVGTAGTNKLSVRDQLVVSYDYNCDVTMDDRMPVIRVENVSLYIPE